MEAEYVCSVVDADSEMGSGHTREKKEKSKKNDEKLVSLSGCREPMTESRKR